MDSFKLIHSEINNLSSGRLVYIPGIWMGSTKKRVRIDYKDFLLSQFRKIEDLKQDPVVKKKNGAQNWSASAVVYNILLRYFTAYDHNIDGVIGGSEDITLNRDGVRETGTFIKTIALLPYLKQLGINTLHLLPVTTIGMSGRKGDLGSPYAIKNPFTLEPSLADPLIHVPVDEQFKAFIEAAHMLGIRVVLEFIFRTTAKDSDWIFEHPEWFYWIDSNAKYHAPEFSEQDLKKILKIPENKGAYIPPPERFRRLFKSPPKKENISLDHSDVIADCSGKTVKIASAFADWPPADLQPPWTDVTYLRMYEYPENKENNYNYISYNTIRYYDPVLATKEHINQPLWNIIAEIIPFYQRKFGIDGAMIDMGHALPGRLKKSIIQNARKIDADFAFWDENFDNTLAGKQEGYNAVIGNTWYKITKRNGFRNVIHDGLRKNPLIYFGCAENHNTPRLTQLKKKKAAWLLFNLLPGAMPFIHNGFELSETLPVNTGLNFNEKQMDALKDKKLPLFYKASMNWDTSHTMIDFIIKIKELKNSYPEIFSPEHLQIIPQDNTRLIILTGNAQQDILYLFNLNFHRKESLNNTKMEIAIRSEYTVLFSSENKQAFDQPGKTTLNRGQILILKKTKIL